MTINGLSLIYLKLFFLKPLFHNICCSFDSLGLDAKDDITFNNGYNQ